MTDFAALNGALDVKHRPLAKSSQQQVRKKNRDTLGQLANR